ncbi:hypothetical protein BDV96DRAFT_599461 [Lophiotrema nucula]|uniref:Uncharacterized protein n=1 Tax=Lophiotrema nucula TaxID=690887 RepID=A0A6A5Z9P0_9PLEO|nr:hypothetical protein BDV96DRAFT_599461 [Lophiotrema nucula]
MEDDNDAIRFDSNQSPNVEQTLGTGASDRTAHDSYPEELIGGERLQLGKEEEDDDSSNVSEIKSGVRGSYGEAHSSRAKEDEPEQPKHRAKDTTRQVSTVRTKFQFEADSEDEKEHDRNAPLTASDKLKKLAAAMRKDEETRDQFICRYPGKIDDRVDEQIAVNKDRLARIH